MKLIGTIIALIMLASASASLLAADKPKSDPCHDPANAPKVTTMANSIRQIEGNPSMSKADKDKALAALSKEDSVVYKCATKTVGNHRKRSGGEGGAKGTALPAGAHSGAGGAGR